MKYVTGFLIVVILCIGLSYWKDSRAWDNERHGYVLNDSLLQKKILDVRDSSNRNIVEYDVQAISAKQLLSSTSAENEQLRKDLKLAHSSMDKVKSSTTVSAYTHDTISFPVDRVISVKDTGIVTVPLSYSPDTFVSATGQSKFRVLDSGVQYLTTTIGVTIRNSTTLTYFNESKILQKEKLRLLVTQLNPYTTTGKIQTYYVNPDKKFFQKWWVHAVVGAGAAIIGVHYIHL